MSETGMYLGDGVYVTYKGYDFELYTQRENGKHYLVLEPQMVKHLCEYMYLVTTGKVVKL